MVNSTVVVLVVVFVLAFFLGAVDVGAVADRGEAFCDERRRGDDDQRSSGSSSTPTRGSRTRWRQAIESRAKIFGLQDMIGRVIVPTEKVREIRKSKKIETEQKFFPGYLLVEMELTDDTWHLVRSTPKVTGLRGLGQPSRCALPPDEVEGILRQMEEGAEKPKLKSIFQKGDKVRVIEGPFVNFQGAIDDLNPERGQAQGHGGRSSGG